MNQAVIRNELILSYPDGFHEMDREELKKLYLDDNPNRWGIWDQDRHIVVAVFWHETNAFLSSLAGARDVAKTTEKKLRKGLKHYGYHRDGFFSETLCGEEVPGFRYTYQLGDVTQAAEVLVLKRKTVCYTIYFYTREKLASASQPVFEEILHSMQNAVENL